MNILNSLYNGTSAYKIDEYARRLETQERERKNYKRKKMFQARVRLLAGMMLVFVLASVMLYRNAVIINNLSQVNTLKSELQMAKDKNAKKNVELENKLDLVKVEEIAETQLGLRRIEKYQTVYVAVEQEDYAELKNEKKEEKTKTFKPNFSVIMSGVRNVLGYLQ